MIQLFFRNIRVKAPIESLLHYHISARSASWEYPVSEGRMLAEAARDDRPRLDAIAF